MQGALQVVQDVGSFLEDDEDIATGKAQGRSVADHAFATGPF